MGDNKSTDRVARAEELIPWGTQTNAKRHKPEMGPVMPHFIERADGCMIQDTRGKWYIDYRSALGPIILGYNHPEVQSAVEEQLRKGVLFSMASPLELDVAEKLVGLIPGLEQVRFLKSGNEVNHVAIRLARALTGRDKIVTCGYHGHGDWFSCGTGQAIGWAWPREGNGVPKALDDLVIKVPYGDVDALDRVFSLHGQEIAGMITVPYDWNDLVGHDFLSSARRLTQGSGAVLIFDQILTGFRLGLRGAQEFFPGTEPDLSTYGKAIANGFPLAAVGGKREVMAMFDRVMITTTHAGETLSLAAALATLNVLEREPVFDHLNTIGKMLMAGFDDLIGESGLGGESYGLPVAPQFRFNGDKDRAEEMQIRFNRSLFENGIFPSSPYLLNYAHKEEHIEKTLDAMKNSVRNL